jgi:hypothetical protein
MRHNPSRAQIIKEAALDRAEALFRAAWGEPERPGAREWRPKDDTARAMIMQGPRRGLWHDHKAGTGGDVLDFIAVEFCGLDRARAGFGRVLREAAALCGVGDDLPDSAALAARRRDRERAAEAAQAAEDARRAALVDAITRRARPVAGTPGAVYLAARGIDHAPPGAVAWLPPSRDLAIRSAGIGALIVWARDAAGRITGGQRILLQGDGTPARVNPRKVSFGAIAGAPARFPARDAGGPLIVAEGPETALSIWRATGLETWAVFGVSGFGSAPLPLGRRVVFAPDLDAAGSPAATAFDAACKAHSAAGTDLHIARTPEAEGPGGDLNDTLRRAGPGAVAAAIAGAAPYAPPGAFRAPSGRFTGAGAVEAPAAPMPDFVPVDLAADRIAEAIWAALDGAAAWDGEGPAPTTVIAADPGAGKSLAALRALACFDLARLPGDAVIYAPTLALADEAAATAHELGAGWHVTRGRSAINPATGEQMCARADLAEEIAAAGLSVKANLCERIETDPDTGEQIARRCPFFEICAGHRAPGRGEPSPYYLAQWRDLPPGPVLRFESHAYLTAPDDGSGRPVGLRIVDEKAWGNFTRHAVLAADDLIAPPPGAAPGRRKRRKGGAEIERDISEAVDLAAAKRAVLAALRAGESPVVAGYEAEDFEAFAKAEGGRETLLPTRPSAPDDAIRREVADLAGAAAAAGRAADRRAVFWRILAEARRAGIERPERIEFDRHWRGPRGDGHEREAIRLHWLADFPTDAPAILLDADADAEIVRRMHPGARIARVPLRPNAEIIQIADRVFAKSSLLDQIDHTGATLRDNRGNRRSWRAIIRREVAEDRARPGGPRGVLVGASKAVIRAFFADAGLIGPDTPPDRAAQIMRDTLLHGARWLWFGPASLGLNEFEHFGTVIVIGREEAPPAALAAEARALFGDRGAPLDLCGAEDDQIAAPYLMAGGSGRAALIRAHPDPRVRALQAQARECATRQLVERLRLARASDPKRVILGCKIPLPGLPIDHLVAFDEFRPGRLASALLEAGGVLRLSAAGLAEDAPETFPTAQAARDWMRREGRAEVNGGKPLIRYNTWAAPIKIQLAQIRREGQRGPRPTPVLLADCADPAAACVARFGPLASFALAPQQAGSGAAPPAPDTAPTRPAQAPGRPAGDYAAPDRRKAPATPARPMPRPCRPAAPPLPRPTSPGAAPHAAARAGSWPPARVLSGTQAVGAIPATLPPGAFPRPAPGWFDLSPIDAEAWR